MKNLVKTISLLVLGGMAIFGCKRHEADNVVPDSVYGVYEGAMTCAEEGTSVEILDISSTTADFYTYNYSLDDDYTVKSKRTYPINVIPAGKNYPVRFTFTDDSGKKCTYAIEDDVIFDADKKGNTYVKTENAISYYKQVQNKERVLPTDKEFTGPSKYSSSFTYSDDDKFNLQEGEDWVAFIEWAAKTAATTAWGKGVSVLLDMLFPSSGSSTTLDDLLDKMNAITDQLAQMTVLYKNTTYESYLNQRSKYVSELSNYNAEYYIRLSNAKTEDDVKTIILEWASDNVGGNPVYVQGFNFIDFLSKTVVEQKDIFNMYDLYTYNTTAWEREGYAIRENLRAGDVAIAAQTFYLTQLYQTLRDGVDDDSRKSILASNITKFEAFTENVKNHPVEHHDNMAICQINGAHFAMDAVNFQYAGSSTYRNPYWCSIPRTWYEYESDMDFMWGPNKVENYNKAITPDEMKNILDYYDGTGWTLGQILVFKAGCQLSFLPVQTIILTLQSNGYSSDWREIGLDKSIDYNAKSSSEIGPKIVGRGYFEVTGTMYTWYLKFLRWENFNENLFWIKTNVLERR